MIYFKRVVLISRKIKIEINFCSGVDPLKSLERNSEELANSELLDKFKDRRLVNTDDDVDDIDKLELPGAPGKYIIIF